MSDAVQPSPQTGKPEPKSVAEKQSGSCAPAANNPQPPSPEEQMDAFEDSLKESDWGHQPC